MAGVGGSAIGAAGSSGGGFGGSWIGPAMTAFGGMMGYLGAKDQAKQQGPWDKKSAKWAMGEAQRLYGGSVMAPMFRMMMFNKMFGGKKGGMFGGMGGMQNMWAQRYNQYNPGGNPMLGGGGYLGQTTTPKGFPGGGG